MVDQAQLLGDKTQRLDGNVHGGVHWTVIPWPAFCCRRVNVPIFLFFSSFTIPGLRFLTTSWQPNGWSGNVKEKKRKGNPQCVTAHTIIRWITKRIKKLGTYTSVWLGRYAFADSQLRLTHSLIHGPFINKKK